MKNKKYLYLLIINFALLTMAFGHLIFTYHLGADDYSCYYNQTAVAAGVIKESYRVLSGLTFYLLSFLKLNVVRFQAFNGLLIIVSFVLGLELLVGKTIELLKVTDFKRMLLIDLAFLLCLVNVLLCEWFWFPMAYLQWAISFISAAMAAYYFVGERKHKNLICFVLLFVCSSYYQLNLAYYVFGVMLFIFLKNDGHLKKESFKEIFIAAFLALTGILLNILLAKGLTLLFFSTDVVSRVGKSEMSLFATFIKLLKNLWHVFHDGLGLMRKNILLVGLVILVIYLIALIIKKRAFNKIFFIALLFISIFVIVSMPVVIQPVFWQPARTAVFYFTFYPLLVVLILYLHDKPTLLLYLLIIGLLSVNIYQIQILTDECLLHNELEKEEMTLLKNSFEKYEEESGEELAYIVFLYDDNGTYKYPQCEYLNYYQGEMGSRSITISWSKLEVIRYWTGYALKEGEVDESIYQYFKQSDYQEYDLSEQLYFEGDTVYLLIY